MSGFKKVATADKGAAYTGTQDLAAHNLQALADLSEVLDAFVAAKRKTLARLKSQKANDFDYGEVTTAINTFVKKNGISGLVTLRYS